MCNVLHGSERCCFNWMHCVKLHCTVVGCTVPVVLYMHLRVLWIALWPVSVNLATIAWALARSHFPLCRLAWGDNWPLPDKVGLCEIPQRVDRVSGLQWMRKWGGGGGVERERGGARVNERKSGWKRERRGGGEREWGGGESRASLSTIQKES